ncbi:uncharacterized protein [Miscanthus floridulus]|uniref:uncharacterized protein n=1 Tax=Miscanthus floridulus TaxID=154761 RepID=UPI003458463D
MDEDWELLLASPNAAAAAEPYAGGGGGKDDAGAIKHDYFDLGFDAKYPRRASLSKEDEDEDGVEEGLLGASDNASWVEPDPDDLLFPGRDRAALWLDSSSDGERPKVEATDPVERATEEAGLPPSLRDPRPSNVDEVVLADFTTKGLLSSKEVVHWRAPVLGEVVP